MGANLLLAHFRRPFDAAKFRDEAKADFEPAPTHILMLWVPSLISPVLLPGTFGLIFPDWNHLFFLALCRTGSGWRLFCAGLSSGFSLNRFRFSCCCFSRFCFSRCCFSGFCLGWCCFNRFRFGRFCFSGRCFSGFWHDSTSKW